MELELLVDPDAVSDVVRLRSLTATREGRPRTQAVKVVWHDSPDHALLRQGLMLAENRVGWRLERVVPSTETWLPGQPAPIIEAAADHASLIAELPASLAPVAAFEGRRTISVYRLAGASIAATCPTASPASSSQAAVSVTAPHLAIPAAGNASPGASAPAMQAHVTLSVERGILRSVAAEHPVARITLSGEDHAVRAAALMIAGVEPASVPRVSLAAQAFALATGAVAAPRHLGAPELPDADMTVADALAHILGHLTDVILHYAPAAATPTKGIPQPKLAEQRDGQHAGAAANSPDDRISAKAAALDTGRIEAVHQMRVAVRRALSAVSICRDALPDGTLDAVHDELRALGGRLGPTRDWDVFLTETIPLVIQSLAPDERLDRLVSVALRQRQNYRNALADYLTSPEFRLLGIKLAWFAAARFWHADGTPANDYAPHNRPPAADPSAGDLPTQDLSRDGPDRPSHGPRAGSPSTSATVRDFAPGVLQRRWKKLLSAGKRIEQLDIPSLHGVRLRAKRARYAAEMFTLPHEGKAAQRFIRRLSLLQQHLGVLNDGAVAAHLLQELGGPSGRHAYAVGVVIGFTAARASKIRPRIIRAFEKFRRQPTYWT